MKIDYLVTIDNIKLKDFILEMGVSRAFARRVKLYGKMYINDVEAKNFYIVHLGDKVTLEYDEKLNEEINVNLEELDICYEDSHIMVVNKRAHLASQPTRTHQYDNLISLIKAYFIKNNITSNIHLVNRLDYSTSGLVIVAKDGYTHNLLSKIDIEKKYYAIVKGHLEKKEDLVNIKIGRVEEHNIKRWVMEDGKESKTLYKVIGEKDGNDLVDVKLLTGRTHQIRVTFSYLSHPIIGDKIYGDGGDDLMLHCYYLCFNNPYQEGKIEVKREPNW